MTTFSKLQKTIQKICDIRTCNLFFTKSFKNRLPATEMTSFGKLILLNCFLHNLFMGSLRRFQDNIVGYKNVESACCYKEHLNAAAGYTINVAIRFYVSRFEINLTFQRFVFTYDSCYSPIKVTW